MMGMIYVCISKKGHAIKEFLALSLIQGWLSYHATDLFESMECNKILRVQAMQGVPCDPQNHPKLHRFPQNMPLFYLGRIERIVERIDEQIDQHTV